MVNFGKIRPKKFSLRLSWHSWPTRFSRLSHTTSHVFVTNKRIYISPERNVASTNQKASVNLQCVPYKVTYFPWPLTQKRLRSVGALLILRPRKACGSIVMSMSVSACGLSVCLSAMISPEPHSRSLPNFCASCLWPWLGSSPASLW